MSPAQKCSLIAVQLYFGTINTSQRNDSLEIAVFDALATDHPKLPGVASYKIHLGNKSIPAGNSLNSPKADTMTFCLPQPLVISPRRDFIVAYRSLLAPGDILLHPGIPNGTAVWRSRRYWYNENLLAPVTWCYYIRAIVEYSSSLPDSVKLVQVASEAKAEREFFLYQNYPNPFNPSTIISYQLSAVSNVTLKVYDILGREVRELVNERNEPGYYSVVWNGRDNIGNMSTSGVYYYQLKAGKFIQTRKMVILH